jgi:hypothetical protein
MLNLKVIYQPRSQIYRPAPAPEITPTPAAAKHEDDKAAPSLVEEWLKVQGIDPSPLIDHEPLPQPVSARFPFRRTRRRV